MKIALLGDVHFGARNDSAAFHKHFAKFYNEVFFPYLEEHNILHVIQLGDVFDRRKYINFQSLQLAREYFFDRLNKDFVSWLLVGNHDTYYKNTNEVNSLDLLLQGYHNIHRINRCRSVEFEGVNFLLVPWWCEENDAHIREALLNTTATHIVGHFEIDGFDLYKGVSYQGEIKPSLFKNFEAVYTGHFHHKSSRGNIHYLGTPYELTWSDFDDPKGFHVFDTETRELSFVQNPFKLHHKLYYNDMTMDVMNINLSQYDETFVKVMIGNKSNPYMFDLFIDKLEKAGAYSVQVVDDHFHMDTLQDTDIVSEAEDTRTIVTKYIKQLDHVVDKQHLESLMLTLYEEALNVE